jgi:hypothetical protein
MAAAPRQSTARRSEDQVLTITLKDASGTSSPNAITSRAMVGARSICSTCVTRREGSQGRSDREVISGVLGAVSEETIVIQERDSLWHQPNGNPVTIVQSRIVRITIP